MQCATFSEEQLNVWASQLTINIGVPPIDNKCKLARKFVITHSLESRKVAAWNSNIHADWVTGRGHSCRPLEPLAARNVPFIGVCMFLWARVFGGVARRMPINQHAAHAAACKRSRERVQKRAHPTWAPAEGDAENSPFLVSNAH